MELYTKKPNDIFEVEHEGSMFHCRILQSGAIHNISLANIADERTLKVDEGATLDAAAELAIIGWENVFDSETKEPIKFNPELIQCLPWAVKMKAVMPSIDLFNKRNGVYEKLKEQGIEVPLSPTGESPSPNTSNSKKSTKGHSAKGAVQNT